MAYSVGLMASDGCLSSDGRHLDLTSNDFDQLENFAKAVGRRLKITNKNNSSPNPAYRIQFSDVAYYDFLLGVGLTPAKSKTIGKLAVPKKYYSHFLRGVFDGDGSLYGYYDPRWKKSYMYYTSFTSASVKFLQYLSEMNQKYLGTSSVQVRSTTRAFRITYAKKDSYKLYCQLYRCSSLFLRRKREKFENFLEINGDGKIKALGRVVESGRHARLRF